jgi:hypothetical protein
MYLTLAISEERSNVLRDGFWWAVGSVGSGLTRDGPGGLSRVIPSGKGSQAVSCNRVFAVH